MNDIGAHTNVSIGRGNGKGQHRRRKSKDVLLSAAVSSQQSSQRPVDDEVSTLSHTGNSVHGDDEDTTTTTTMCLRESHHSDRSHSISLDEAREKAEQRLLAFLKFEEVKHEAELQRLRFLELEAGTHTRSRYDIAHEEELEWQTMLATIHREVELAHVVAAHHKAEAAHKAATIRKWAAARTHLEAAEWQARKILQDEELESLADAAISQVVEESKHREPHDDCQRTMSCSHSPPEGVPTRSSSDADKAFESLRYRSVQSVCPCSVM